MPKKRYFEHNLDNQGPQQNNFRQNNANYEPIQNFRGRGRGGRGGGGGGGGARHPFRRNQDGFRGRPAYQGEDSPGPSSGYHKPIDGHKPWYRYGYGAERHGRKGYGVMSNVNVPPPPKQFSDEEKEYMIKNRKNIQNKIDQAQKDIKNKIQVRSTVQQLKEKLSRRRHQSESNSPPALDYNDAEMRAVQSDDEEPRQETLAANTRFREPQLELFDIEMSNRDFRDVGSGQVSTSPEDYSSRPVPRKSNTFIRISRSEEPEGPKRIANRPTNPRPKKQRKIVTGPSTSTDEAGYSICTEPSTSRYSIRFFLKLQ